MNKNTICLWFERNAEEAARFYTSAHQFLAANHSLQARRP